MDIIADASAFLAVALEEADKTWIVKKTAGLSLRSPEILYYEIGNALSALHRRRTLHERDILKVFEITRRIPVKLIAVKIHDALKIASKYGIYAYDAYYLQCCLETKSPLLSLDKKMCAVARKIGIEVMEK